MEAGYLGERMGLQPGDVAYNVNDQSVDDWETFVRYIVRSTGEPLTVHLIRAGRNLRFESPAEAGR